MNHPCEDCRQSCDIPCWKVDHGLLVEPSRWISVEDRLPDEDDKCLVWNGHHIFVAIYWGDGVWKFDSYACEITHWMPLPEPPKEDNDG